MSEQLNIAVFASGKGSNFRAILESIKSQKIKNANIALVISNNSDAGVLGIAREHDIPAFHISRKQFSTDDEFNHKLISLLKTFNINLIVLAGYMKKLDSKIVRTFKNRIVNIHPALLPKYGGTGMYGMNVHKAVISNKEKISGATVHIVDEEYDHGPIVLQKSIDVEPTDTPETLAEKVLQLEHEIYPEAIRLFAEGKIKVEQDRVIVLNENGIIENKTCVN